MIKQKKMLLQNITKNIFKILFTADKHIKHDLLRLTLVHKVIKTCEQRIALTNHGSFLWLTF